MTGRRWLIALSSAVVVAAIAAVIGLRMLPGAQVAATIATRGEVVEQVSGPGTVQARVPVTLSARLTSTVAELAVDVGDLVRPGQVVVILEARELVARRAAVARQQQSLASQAQAAIAAVAKARAELDSRAVRPGVRRLVAAGGTYPALPMFGITPCPGTLFTFGVLLLSSARVPWWALMIPTVWSLVGGSAAFLLHVPQPRVPRHLPRP